MTYLHTGIFGKTLVEDLQGKGFSRSEIVGNTGIDISLLNGEEPKVPFDSLALLFERAAELTGDDLLGFRHAQNSDYRRLGLIAFTGVSSPNVRSLLHTLSRYQRINSDVLLMDSSQLGNEGILQWHYQVPRRVVRQQFVEFNATGLVHVLRRLTGRELVPLDLGFRHFRGSNLQPLVQYFGRTPELGSAENRLQFRLEDLDLPLQTSDHLLNRMLTKFSEDALAQLAESKPSLANSVEEIIAQSPTKTQAEVARDLGMSARSLSRRLAEADTSFFKVVEGYREAVAKNMLRESDFQLTEIAFVLGYSDLSTFSTAFRRWAGSTPTEYRKQFRR